MPRRTLSQIVEEIKFLLQNEKELSVRQIAIKTKCQWRTALKALELMENLDITEERQENKSNRDERLFKLIK